MVISGLVETWLKIVYNMPLHVTGGGLSSASSQVEYFRFTLPEWFMPHLTFQICSKSLSTRETFPFFMSDWQWPMPWMQNGFLLTCIDKSQGNKTAFPQTAFEETQKFWNRSGVRSFLDTSFASNFYSASNQYYNPKFQLWEGTAKLILENMATITLKQIS